MDKSKLLDQCGALGDDRLLLARVLDRARQASERNVPAATDFLSPAQQAMAMDMLRTAGISDTAYVRLGGYDDAERALLLFLPDWLDAADAEGQSPIRCLRAQLWRRKSATVSSTMRSALSGLEHGGPRPAECLRNRAGTPPHSGGPVRGAAGHRFLPTAGRRVRHGLPHGPG